MSDLRVIDLFDELDDAQLAEWEAAAEPFAAPAGTLLARQDEPSPGFHLLYEGTVVALKAEPGGVAQPVGTHQAPTWIGAIPTLTEAGYQVTMRCTSDVRGALIKPDDLLRLVLAQRPVFRRVLRQFGPVMTRVAANELNRERLAALGTMAAGLAHELNNPAAAARRAAAELTEAVRTTTASLQSFVESGVERAEAEELVALQREAVARAAAATALDALDAADAEDELLARLEALGVPEPWRLAEPLAAAGVDQPWLDEVARLAGPATDAALRWVAATLTAGRLAAELEESTGRISQLVGAVKSYTYMDRGDLVETDVHEGLETTLTVLGHKLKHTSIAVQRDYDRELPHALVRGSELNQVWTNLLDNAIAALGESGTITIRTRHDADCAVVEIEDDGPGIAPDAQPRVFEPFFTTKDVGQGTGLGLATARRIVVDRHAGSLTFDSRPGRTVFRTRFPLRAAV